MTSATSSPWIRRPTTSRITIRTTDGNEITGWADERYRGPVNLTAPAQIDNAAFTRAFAGALSRPALLPVPGALLGLLGEMADELLLGGAAVVPARAQALGFEFAHPEIDGALRDLLGPE